MAKQLPELENAILAQSLMQQGEGGACSVKAPTCCGQSMEDDGGCSEGCCDDFKCGVCGKTLRIGWPD